MNSRITITLTMLLHCCHIFDARLNLIPLDTIVKLHDSTFMNCSTSLEADTVHWRHDDKYINTAVGILDPYKDRFSIEIYNSTGASNLLIRSVQPSDAGTYKCLEDEGFGAQGSAQLIVLDNDPVCKSNMHSDGVIGPNSCDIDPEEFTLACSIKYHGNSLPVLQWRMRGNNQSITDGRFNVTSSINEVTYTLTMNSTLDLNNASFICETKKTSGRQYRCSGDVTKIIYVFSSELTVNMTVNDEVSCFANSSQSCSYKWKWFNGDDVTTESDTPSLKPRKVGWHRCEATCSIGSQSCTVQSMYAEIYSTATVSEQHPLTLLVLLLLPAFAVGLIGAIVYYRRRKTGTEVGNRGHEEINMISKQDGQQRLLDVERRRLEEIERQRQEEEERQRREEVERHRREEEEHKRLHGLIATIRTKAAEERKKRIDGFTILDNELFVVSRESSEVEVYDTKNFSFSRQWTLKTLINPGDIASCIRNKYLYISDYKVSGLSNEIFRIDPSGKLIKKWSTKNDSGRLSVTYDSNVILAAYHQNKLNEYSPDGQFIREIHLSSEEGFCHPHHAIKLTNGHFVVSHGSATDDDDDDDDLHRVCIVDAGGKLLKSFGEKRGSTIRQTHTPAYLSVDRSGSVMVADFVNNRVLLLDSNLEFKKEILSHEHGLGYPHRILLDESNGRIFASNNDENNSSIKIFDLGQLTQPRNVTLNP